MLKQEYLASMHKRDLYLGLFLIKDLIHIFMLAPASIKPSPIQSRTILERHNTAGE